MNKKTFGLIIVSIIIIVVIYLFINIKQENVECIKSTTDELNINIVETLDLSIRNNIIDKMELYKQIILPNNLNNQKNLDMIQEKLKYYNEYLGENNIKFRTKDNSITLVSSVKDKEILLLDNIDFENKGELIMNINPNTTDDSIIRINNKDKYDSSEFMIYMKDKGYKCR